MADFVPDDDMSRRTYDELYSEKTVLEVTASKRPTYVQSKSLRIVQDALPPEWHVRSTSLESYAKTPSE